MPKSYIEKRVKFLNKDDQKEFIELVKKRIGKGTKGVAVISKVGVRQISDWKNAKSTLSLRAFKKLISVTGISKPFKVKIVGRYDHTSSAGKKGFLAVVKKYGEFPKNETHRKENWQKWWKNTGRYQKREIFKRISIKTPKKNAKLAELCGILIGDGGITKRQVKITLNSETDKKYAGYIVKLIRHLFGVKPKIYKIKNSKAINICVSRTELVNFLIKQGLKLGNKLENELSIPAWINKNPRYITLCIRGMIDTDGCVIIETHRIKGRTYVYYRLNLTSASHLLVEQTATALRSLGFHPKIRRAGRSVQLENLDEIWEYFKRVGTSNPKHLNRLGRRGSRG